MKIIDKVRMAYHERWAKAYARHLNELGCVHGKYCEEWYYDTNKITQTRALKHNAIQAVYHERMYNVLYDKLYYVNLHGFDLKDPQQLLNYESVTKQELGS